MIQDTDLYKVFQIMFPDRTNEQLLGIINNEYDGYSIGNWFRVVSQKEYDSLCSIYRSPDLPLIKHYKEEMEECPGHCAKYKSLRFIWFNNDYTTGCNMF